jgi:superfamily II DNA or RNA helicase
MSLKVKTTKFSSEEREKIYSDLLITICNEYGGQERYVYPYEFLEDDFIIPFHYAINRLNLTQPSRENYKQTAYSFKGILRDDNLDNSQKIVKKQALNIMSETGSVIISARTGFGKCLGKNTNVLMFDGSTKVVQDIKVGDILIGDDSKPRNVLSVSSGHEKMYRVKPKIGKSFTCNQSHILSLKDKVTDKIIDIDILSYKDLPETDRHNLYLYRVPVNFQESPVLIDPYLVGLWLGENGYDYIFRTVFQNINSVKYTQEINLFCKMIREYRIPKNYIHNSEINRMKLLAGIIDSPISVFSDNKYKITSRISTILRDITTLVNSLGFISEIENDTLSFYGPNMSKIPTITKKCNHWNTFIGSHLLTSEFELEEIDETEYFGFEIDGNRRFLLADCTVTHNTVLGVSIAQKCKMMTLVLAHRLILIDQWVESFKKFAPDANVKVLMPKQKVDPTSDVLIINASNIVNFPENTFKDVGLLIVDECHLILAETISKSLMRIFPRYILGLSATPYRKDGLNKLLTLYFGDQKIIREMNREHTIYQIYTGFKPTIEKAANGRINWNVVLSSQSQDFDRNTLICDLLCYFSDRIFLVLVKRVDHGKVLETMLKERNESVTTMFSSSKSFDKTARILVGTTNKLGVGFDHSRLDALCLATDIKDYFAQYLGRVFRNETVVPLILDFIDDNLVLKQHFNVRREQYQKSGGIIKRFDLSRLEK